jgi:hypothetical protein
MIEDDLRRIDADDVCRVGEIVRTRCCLSAAVDAYERVYKMAIAAPRSPMSPAATSWKDPYDKVLAYANELEARLRVGEGAWSMPPLPPASAEAIAVSSQPPE